MRVSLAGFTLLSENLNKIYHSPKTYDILIPLLSQAAKPNKTASDVETPRIILSRIERFFCFDSTVL
jgi:hypothetical protein